MFLAEQTIYTEEIKNNDLENKRMIEELCKGRQQRTQRADESENRCDGCKRDADQSSLCHSKCSDQSKAAPTAAAPTNALRKPAILFAAEASDELDLTVVDCEEAALPEPVAGVVVAARALWVEDEAPKKLGVEADEVALATVVVS